MNAWARRQHAARGCADRRSHQSGSEERGRGRPLSRRPVLSIQCLSPSHVAMPYGIDRDDIPLLAKHFVEVSVKELGCAQPRLTRAGIETDFRIYDWPGNIRELRNVIERAAIFAQGGALEFDLPLGGSPADVTLFCVGAR